MINASSGSRWQVSGAETNWRTAPNICLALNGTCSTGQRSRYNSRTSRGSRGNDVATSSGVL